MGYVVLFMLLGLGPFGVLTTTMVFWTLAGRHRAAMQLMLCGGLGLAAASGCAVGSMFLGSSFSTSGSQEMGFVVVFVVGAWVVTGLLALVGSLALYIADR